MRNVVMYAGEDGYWVVVCPSLPGCISQGKTKEEAIVNIKEAIEVWIEDAKAHNEPIPEERFEAVLMVLEIAPTNQNT